MREIVAERYRPMVVVVIGPTHLNNFSLSAVRVVAKRQVFF